jgi:SAM-dependent methyltransferase
MVEKITFSFGKNWKNYVESISDDNIYAAKQDILEWLGEFQVRGKSVLDIGSGSGIHSYCFYLLGANKIFSFDYDKNSVEATSIFWEKAGKPSNWTVTQGSVLENEFVSKIAESDIVYSWGVLHHTGDMWNAIKNAASLVKAGGFFFISIYAKGPNYERHLALKRKFNEKGSIGKWWMIWEYIFKRHIWRRIKRRQNPFLWNEKKVRGMNVYNDVVDWLGGLPYEVAHEQELSDFLSKLGFKLEKAELRGEGACHRLLYKRF